MDTMYCRIEELCRKTGTNITAMCRQLQISRSSLSELKAGRTKVLSAQYTARICRYFQVPVEYLLGKNDQPFSANYELGDTQLQKSMQLLHDRPELRQLLLACQKMGKEEILALVHTIQKKENSGVGN